MNEVRATLDYKEARFAIEALQKMCSSWKVRLEEEITDDERADLVNDTGFVEILIAHLEEQLQPR